MCHASSNHKRIPRLHQITSSNHPYNSYHRRPTFFFVEMINNNELHNIVIEKHHEVRKRADGEKT